MHSNNHFIILSCVVFKLLLKIYLIQKHPECKKRSSQELKKGLDKKGLKSKWSVNADKNKILIIIIKAAKY